MVKSKPPKGRFTLFLSVPIYLGDFYQIPLIPRPFTKGLIMVIVFPNGDVLR